MSRVMLEKVPCRILLPERMFDENNGGLFAKVKGDPFQRGFRYQGNCEIFCTIPELPDYASVTVQWFPAKGNYEEMFRVFINPLPVGLSSLDVEKVFFSESMLTRPCPDGGYESMFDISAYDWATVQVSIHGGGNASLFLLAIGSVDGGNY